MGHERPRGGAPGDRLHHGGLDLQEPARLQKRADEIHDRRAPLEDPPGRLVHDEVEVALAVAGLLIGQAVELLG
jgi:hypothetical protein